jgi:hypothetical protein
MLAAMMGLSGLTARACAFLPRGITLGMPDNEPSAFAMDA